MKSIELQAKVIFAGLIYKHKHSLTCKHDDNACVYISAANSNFELKKRVAIFGQIR